MRQKSRHHPIHTEHETVYFALICSYSTLFNLVHLYSRLRNHPITTGHKIIYFALICPDSTFYTYIRYPGIIQSALDMRQFIAPSLACIQHFTPIFNAHTSINRHWTWDNLFLPYSTLFNLIQHFTPISNVQASPITNEHKTIHFTLIQPYSTFYTYIQCPGITQLALVMRQFILPYPTLCTHIWCPSID
jgi:hypothetical protein